MPKQEGSTANSRHWVIAAACLFLVLVAAVIVAVIAVGVRRATAFAPDQCESPVLMAFAPDPELPEWQDGCQSESENPTVHVNMTTIPERFASDWFASNMRKTLTTMRGKFVWWCNVPPVFEHNGEPYVVNDKVQQLLDEFPNFRLFHVNRDDGPITKVLGPLYNPEIHMTAPLLICDDDFEYKNEFVRIAAAHFAHDSTRVYAYGGRRVTGFQGFALQKLQCVGILANMPLSCRRIDDELLDLHFEGKTVPITYLGNRQEGCTIVDFVADAPPGEFSTALRQDFRPPMIQACKRDFQASFGTFCDAVAPPSFRPRVAVCMWYNEGIYKYADLTRQLNQRYCDAHGYTLVVDSADRIPSSVRVDMTQFEWCTWQRMPQLVEVMNSDAFDWVVWIDADAAFRPPSSGERGDDKLRKLLFTYRDLDVVFSADHPRDPFLNCGVMAFRNTAFSRQLLNYYNLATASRFAAHACVVGGKSYDGNKYHDQSCVRQSYVNNVLELKNHSVIVPYGLVQTFHMDDRKYPNAMIMHVSGTSADARYAFFKDMLKVLEPPDEPLGTLRTE